MSQAVVRQLYLCLLVILLSSCAVTPREHFIPKVEKPESGFDTGFGCETEDITNMYADYIESWKKEIASSFDTAEKEVFKDDIKPDVVGPHPDPDKCICKGSGVIVQGDGHKTPCPYHGSKMMKHMNKDVIVKPLIILEK